VPLTALTAPLLAAASAEGGGGGLADINLGLMIWSVVLFAIFAFVLTKLGWKPLLELIEERERRIQSAVETAQQAQTEAQALLVQQKEVLRETGRQREDLIKQALSEADRLRAELTAQARAQSEAMVQRAREQIQREKRLAVQELRTQVAELAIEAAGRIVTSSLTPAAQRQLVDDFLRELPAAEQS
jgi:F-type H+-transporting ATPase subunit b